MSSTVELNEHQLMLQERLRRFYEFVQPGGDNSSRIEAIVRTGGDEGTLFQMLYIKYKVPREQQTFHDRAVALVGEPSQEPLTEQQLILKDRLLRFYGYALPGQDQTARVEAVLQAGIDETSLFAALYAKYSVPVEHQRFH
jgi:hypothetical protein